MFDILFSIVLFILSLFMIFISKVIMYKVFKCDSYRKNLYFSTGILTLVTFLIFVILVFFISIGNKLELSSNIFSFSLVYLTSLLISVIINCVFENIFYKNKKFIYIRKTKKS